MARASKASLVVLLAAGSAGAEEITIAALGDSLTAGYGLPEGEGFVPQLQAWLDDRGQEAVVVNAGVSGDTTAGGLARLGWTLTPEVDALILELGANDFLRGLPPETARENLDAILAQAAEAGLPVLIAGLPAPGNFGPDYKAEFDAIYPDLAAAYGALLYPDFLAALRAANAAGTAPEDLLQPDGLHPTAHGVSLMVEDIGPMVETLISRAD